MKEAAIIFREGLNQNLQTVVQLSWGSAFTCFYERQSRNARAEFVVEIWMET